MTTAEFSVLPNSVLSNEVGCVGVVRFSVATSIRSR